MRRDKGGGGVLQGNNNKLWKKRDVLFSEKCAEREASWLDARRKQAVDFLVVFFLGEKSEVESVSFSSDLLGIIMSRRNLASAHATQRQRMHLIHIINSLCGIGNWLSSPISNHQCTSTSTHCFPTTV